MDDRVYQTSTTRFWLGEDGIAHVVYLPDSFITLETAMETIGAIRKIDNKSRPVLQDIRNVRGATREARLYFASGEVASITKAAAVFVDSPVTGVLGSFFMGLNKPEYPIKIFTDREKAIDWLREFL